MINVSRETKLGHTVLANTVDSYSDRLVMKSRNAARLTLSDVLIVKKREEHIKTSQDLKAREICQAHRECFSLIKIEEK